MNLPYQGAIGPLKMTVLVTLMGIVLQACNPAEQPPQATNESTLVSQPANPGVNPETKGITIDGSSTVFPITEAIVGDYQRMERKAAKVDVAFSGTGGGFKKFCAGETDINNASRPISEQEMAACKQAGVTYIELPIAFDALTLVIHPKNTWAKDITVEELKKIWEPAAEGKITTWQQVRAEWPDRPLKLFGPGKESGTFDYFTEAIVGKAKASRSDYTASEDDTTLVKGVASDENALGYFGFAYYEASLNRLKPLSLDSGKGPVLPARETVRDGSYQPLSRPLFIYVNAKAVVGRPELKAFVEYYLQNAERYVKQVGYIPLDDEVYRIGLAHLQENRTGTAFGGRAQISLKLEELLQKEKQF
ncbi:MAG: PstS family phosphate ABC transporter substrate-binding protein [Leptolyngbyaceae cyanobacterium bins.59]|nr:PstS family phosphate ABC transporter substrate-binding protein [Leptolyngbyaceae cyanobacterium bins.59]